MGVLLRIAAAAGLTCGLVEVALVAIRKWFLHGWVFLSPHAAWMTPAGYVALFVLLVPIAWVAGRLAPRLAADRALLAACVFLGSLGWSLVFSPAIHPASAVVLAAGVAAATLRVVTAKPDRMHRLARRVVPAGLALCVLFALAVLGRSRLAERRGRPAIAARGPNVVLVVFDAVRGMNTSLLGYQRPTTPALRRLAERGVTFSRAIAASSWTMPSHASMFTGALPPALGVSWFVPLPPDHRVLAEAMSDAGYRTGGFTGNLLMATREAGLARGFSRFTDHLVKPAELARSPALLRWIGERHVVQRVTGWRVNRNRPHEVNEAFFDWLNADSAAPFFAYLNYFDAHLPYLANDSLRAMFAAVRPREGLWTRVWNGGHPLSGERTYLRDRQTLIGEYDAGIASDDAALAELLASLDERGLSDRTIVIVTADHGEEFYSRGAWEHGNTLFWPAIHVPLVLAGPGAPPGIVVTRPATTMDIAATALALAGVRDSLIEGRSLDRYWRDSAASAHDTVLATVRPPPHAAGVVHSRAWSLLSGDLHYLRHWNGEEKLYDVGRDPMELTNLIAEPAWGEAREAFARRVAVLDSVWKP